MKPGAWGLGVYSVFIYPDVGLTRAIETPKNSQIRFHYLITVALGDYGLDACCRSIRGVWSISSLCAIRL